MFIREHSPSRNTDDLIPPKPTELSPFQTIRQFELLHSFRPHRLCHVSVVEDAIKNNRGVFVLQTKTKNRTRSPRYQRLHFTVGFRR